MLSANNRIKETISSAPGTGTFNLPATASAGGFRTWKDGITTRIGTGTRAVPYVACDNSSLFEIGVGYFDPSGNSGNGTISRVASLVSDGTSGRGSLVNFTAGNVDVFCDWSAVKLSYAGIDSYQISEFWSDFLAATSNFMTPFTVSSNGSGSVAGGANGGSNTTGIFGTCVLATGTTTTGNASVVLGSTNPAGSPQVTTGKGLLVFEALLNVKALSNSTDTFNAYVGIFTGDTTRNGVWFQCGGIAESNGVAAGNWGITTTRWGPTTTYADSGVAVDTSNYQRLRIELRHDANRVDFFINGNNVGNFTTGIATGDDFCPFGVSITKSAGTTSRELWVDTGYFGYIPTSIRN